MQWAIQKSPESPFFSHAHEGICYTVMVMKRFPFLSESTRRLLATMGLLFFSAAAIVFAFPGTRPYLVGAWTNAILLVFLLVLTATGIQALFKKRWLSTFFHLGAALILIGGGLTASHAKEGHIVFTDALYAPIEYRQCLIDGDRVALHSFEIPTYPNGMPRQYITRLAFPEGLRTVKVNAPLRRKGWTYYQMSYQQVVGDYGEPLLNTILTVRKDPGATITFCGYATLILAAFAMAIRETFRRHRAQQQECMA